MKITVQPMDSHKNYQRGGIIPTLPTTIEIADMHWAQTAEDWHYPEHRHPRLFELSLAIEGSQYVTVEKQQYTHSEGSLIYVLPEECHSQTADPVTGKCILFCLHFYLDDPAFHKILVTSDRRFFPADSTEAEKIRGAMLQLYQILQENKEVAPSLSIRMQAITLEILAKLGDALSEPYTASPSVNSDAIQLAQKVAHAIECAAKFRLYKEKPIAVDIRGADLFPRQGDSLEHSADEHAVIKTILNRFGISQSYCNRIFRSVYGIGPREYLSNIKLREAKLLLQRNTPIEQIAEYLGYRDVVPFSRQFKRWTGYSPRQYRLRYF